MQGSLQTSLPLYACGHPADLTRSGTLLTSPTILSLPLRRQHSDRDPATPSRCHDPQGGGPGEGGARGRWTAVPPQTGGHCGSFPPAQPSDGPRNTPRTAGRHSAWSEVQTQRKQFLCHSFSKRLRVPFPPEFFLCGVWYVLPASLLLLPTDLA